MTRIVAIVIVAVTLGVGCSDDSAGADAGCNGPTGCNQVCELGNDYGVGHYCSKGGGECAGLTAALCTVDFEDTTETFCTRPCNPDDDVELQCGQNAVCRGEEAGGSGPSGCVLAMCQ